MSFMFGPEFAAQTYVSHTYPEQMVNLGEISMNYTVTGAEVDLRGQGRSTRTPGRYTLDNMGDDLVRFMQIVIQKPCIVAGLSSGGVLSAGCRPMPHPISSWALTTRMRRCFLQN